MDLGTLDTTGFAEESDTITVTVTDQSSQALATATGQGSVIIGSPVTAVLSVSPTNAADREATVTNTLQINSANPLPDPLTLDGQVQTTPTADDGRAVPGRRTHNLAYVCGPNGIDIVDVSNPASPVDDGTFGGATSSRADSPSAEWTKSAARTT